ncbi:response regulator [Candidatus Azambacteria bacterium]|nr:response regulator [Candidatus Azambacteria bacterium]
MKNEPKKVLIVEDEQALVRAIQEKLKKEGISVLTAKDGETGLETALLEHPDLILLDIIMPKMNGIEMLRELKEDAWGKSAKVIILSNLSDGEMVSEAFKMGIYDFLVKSDWSLDDVVDKVKQKLK